VGEGKKNSMSQGRTAEKGSPHCRTVTINVIKSADEGRFRGSLDEVAATIMVDIYKGKDVYRTSRQKEQKARGGRSRGTKWGFGMEKNRAGHVAV